MKTLRMSFGLMLICLFQTQTVRPAAADVGIRQSLVTASEEDVQMLTLDDGSLIYGRIVIVKKDTVVVQTRHGSVRMVISSIQRLKNVSNQSRRTGPY